MKVYHLTMINRPEAPYLDYIRLGIKHAEGRIAYPHLCKIKKGDRIVFRSHKTIMECEVTFLHHYKDFRTLLAEEGAQKMLPQLTALNLSPDEAIAKGITIYEAFPNAERVKNVGCLAIGVRFLGEKKKS